MGSGDKVVKRRKAEQDVHDKAQDHSGFMTLGVRRKCAEGFKRALDSIEEIASGENEKASIGEQIRAFTELGKYGITESQSILLDHSEWMPIIFEATRRHLSGQAYDAWSLDVKSSLETVEGLDADLLSKVLEE